MIAALGMYDLPALQSANDRFWQAIRQRLKRGPDTLDRTSHPWEVWTRSDLLFAQTCGMPYRTALHGKVQLIGTPDYALDDCPPGYYQSVLVVRADDPRQTESGFDGARFAYNDAVSQSGWAAPIVHLRARGVHVGELTLTGAHAASAQAVADGHVDLAGIDALTWALLSTHDPITDQLRVLARTTPTPGLPYITALDEDAAELFTATREAIKDLDDADRAALHLKDLVSISADAYLAVPSPPPPAA